jgi:histidinol-phosphate aminotransferase
MASYGFESKLINIEPYIPGEQSNSPGLIKLNTNENPFPPAPVVGAVVTGFTARELIRYPSPDASELKSALANYYRVDSGRVFVGNGSDEVLALAFRAFFNSPLPVLFPDITYSFYPVWCRLFNIRYETQALDENFRISTDDYLKPNGGIVICNPNAPTSLGEKNNFIEYIINENRNSVVIVDEAYAEFSSENTSAIPLTEKYDNLIVTRSFSKSRSLAGLRIGYSIGGKLLTKKLTAVKDSFNSYTLDRIAIAGGVASLSDKKYYMEALDKLLAVREKYATAYRGLGFMVFDSETNFLFMKHDIMKAENIYRALAERNILVRHFANPRIENWLRVSVGTDEQMAELNEALQEILFKEEG